MKTSTNIQRKQTCGDVGCGLGTDSSREQRGGVFHNTIKKIINHSRIKSPHIIHYDASGCNGCSIETLACLTPRYDIERFGAVEKGNPRHADILIVSGALSHKSAPRLKRIYEQMPEPKAVMSLGACGISSGVFKDAYNIIGPLDKIIPVDIYVAGCPPKPEAIINGLLKALGVWKKKLDGQE